MPSKPLVLENTVLFILFFFAEYVFLYKKVFNSHCNIATLKGSEGKTALRPVQCVMCEWDILNIQLMSVRYFKHAY